MSASSKHASIFGETVHPRCSIPMGIMVCGAQTKTLAPILENPVISDRATLECAISPIIEIFRSLIFPFFSLTLIKSSKAWEGCACIPSPALITEDFTRFEKRVKDIQAAGLAVFVWMECTIWETAWYLRGMENLMVDMATEDAKATRLLDIITEKACYRAEKFAAMGVDILGLGDDIGMQETSMMSSGMYRQWLGPRLKLVIQAAKAILPDILISYHSCGKTTTLVPELIDAGIDILNPVQPECMDFEETHQQFGDQISFNGTIGTQKLMPFGTPQQIRDEVFKNMDIAGEKGGLFCCPTHVVEPDVPWENIEAYVQACRDYK